MRLVNLRNRFRLIQVQDQIGEETNDVRDGCCAESLVDCMSTVVPIATALVVVAENVGRELPVPFRVY